MGVEPLILAENEPYPNNRLPLLLYRGVLAYMTDTPSAEREVFALFQRNGYFSGWVNGIYERHHFHSTAHEVLACITEKAEVQFGGPGGSRVTFAKGDVVLIPAGVAHKLIEKTADFKVVGAYPDGQVSDMQYGARADYGKWKRNSEAVALPRFDPIHGDDGAVQRYW